MEINTHMLRGRQTQDFLRSPEERTKGALALCPYPGMHLAELEAVPQSQGFQGPHSSL